MTDKEAYEKVFLPLVSDENKFYMFYPIEHGGGFGDIVIVGGLTTAVADSLKKTIRFVCSTDKPDSISVATNKEAVFICSEKYKRLGLEFDGVTMCYLNPDVHHLIHKYICANNLYDGDNYRYGFFKRDSNGRTIRNRRLDITSQYKESLFNIPLETPLQPPRVQTLSLEEKFELHSKYLINKNSTVILCPYARCTKNLPESFWENLVTELYDIAPHTTNQLCIYTNVKDNSQATIKQTYPISVTPREMFYIAENSLCVIGNRCGFMEFLSISNGKTFILEGSVFENGLSSMVYDTKTILPFSNAHCIYFVDRPLEFIKEFISGDFARLPERIELFKQVINRENVTFVNSYDEVIKFIGNTVSTLLPNNQ